MAIWDILLISFKIRELKITPQVLINLDRSQKKTKKELFSWDHLRAARRDGSGL
jgi:hypothetical protein